MALNGSSQASMQRLQPRAGKRVKSGLEEGSEEPGLSSSKPSAGRPRSALETTSKSKLSKQPPTLKRANIDFRTDAARRS